MNLLQKMKATRIIFLSLACYLIASFSMSSAIVPLPAADQTDPIAITGAVIHVGDGEVIADGVITFTDGIITAIGSANDNIDLRNHLVIDIQGQHVYPGFVLPNTTLGLNEVSASRATQDNEEYGDINASVRAAIAYNTDSEIISTHRFNGILTAQVTPQGGLVAGSSTLMKLDGWNWEDAALRTDDGMHLNWPPMQVRRRNPQTFEFETQENEEYAGAVQILHSLFQSAQAYTGERLNLNLQAMQPLFDGSAKLYLHANEAKAIISAVRFARSYPIAGVVVVGGREALMVKDLLLAEDIPVLYEAVHNLPGMAWRDIDEPYKMPFLLTQAGLKIGLSGGATDMIQRQRNLPFLAGTAAAYGLDQETALMLITKNNAEILGVDNRIGTLEVGKDATLFVSTGDALDMRTSQILGAYIQGRDIDLFGTQQQLYERFRDKYSNQVE